MVWVTCWIRIVGEYFNHPGYRFVLVEMFRLTHFWGSRFFLRLLNVPHFYFIEFVERLLSQVFQFFKFIWFGQGVYGVSEGDDNKGGRLGI